MSAIQIEITPQPPIVIGVNTLHPPISVTSDEQAVAQVIQLTPGAPIEVHVDPQASYAIDVNAPGAQPDVIEVGVPGPPGPPGPQGIQGLSGPAIEIQRLAGEVLSALKVVTTNGQNKAVLAQPNDTFEKGQAIGITLAAAGVDQPVAIRAFGVLQDAFFNFPQGEQLYLGVNGTITDVPPSSGLRVVIGKSLGPSEIFIEITQPLIL